MVEPTLEFISQQLERVLVEQRAIRDELRDMRAEIHELGRRVTSIEAAIGLVFSQVATLNNRLDRMESK